MSPSFLDIIIALVVIWFATPYVIRFLDKLKGK